MVTIFSIPKAFKGHVGVIQRNAIKSWTLLQPQPEVILFGKDEGTAEVARELGIRHLPDIATNEFGTPLLNDLFHKAEAAARFPILCYVNCDIILMDDFSRALARANSAHREFLMIGRRTDVDIHDRWPFEAPAWQAQLQAHAARHGRKRPASWIDYFAFSRGLYEPDMPPFAVGRTYWDKWLVAKVLESGKPVLDASTAVLAVHQNHDYSHHVQGEYGAWHGVEARRNAKLAGGSLRSVADANRILGKAGEYPNLRRPLAAPWHYAKTQCFSLWFAILNVTRPLRSLLGLRSKTQERSNERA